MSHRTVPSSLPLRRASSSLCLALAVAGALPRPAAADATPECNNGPEYGSTECGTNSTASANRASAFGFQAAVGRPGGTAIGAEAVVAQAFGIAIGTGARVNEGGGGAITIGPIPTQIGGTAIGALARTQGDNNVALGGYALVGIRTGFTAVHDGTAIGAASLVSADGGTALGANTSASGADAMAMGRFASATAANSVAIGARSVADQANTVSFGFDGYQRRLTQVDEGTEDTDAVNLRQMRAADDDLGGGIAAWLGGGAAYAGGAFTAPVYVIQSNNYGNVGAAFGAVDAALDNINQRIVDVGGIQGERGYSAYEVAVQNGFAGTEADWLGSLQGPAGPGGPQGPEGPAGGGPRSVVYDDDGRDVLTLAGADGTTIANLADGVAATDAANVRQIQAGDAATLASANTYTDTVAVQTLQSANEYTDSRFAAWDAQLDSIQRGIDDRFQRQDRRIDRQGAMGSAMLNMAINAAGSQSPRGRIAVGAGFQGGEQALSVGYGRKVGERASFSLGGAFSGGEKSAGIGFGLDL
nr:YadA-like family protein [Luteimonas saliphila]